MKKYLPIFIAAASVLFFAPKAHAAITLIQATTSPASFLAAAGTTTQKFTSNVTAGNFLIVSFGQNANTTGTISDSLGNKWVNAQDAICNGGASCNFNTASNDVFYVTSSLAGVDTISVHFVNSGWTYIAAFEYSGIATTSPVDAATSSQCCTTATSSMPTGNITTTNASDLLFTYKNPRTIPTSTANITVTSGFTIRTNANVSGGNATGVTADQTVAATGSYGNTFKYNATTITAISGIVAFKAASGGGGGSTTPNPYCMVVTDDW